LISTLEGNTKLLDRILPATSETGTLARDLNQSRLDPLFVAYGVLPCCQVCITDITRDQILIDVRRVRIMNTCWRHELGNAVLADDMSTGLGKHSLRGIAQHFLAGGADSLTCLCGRILLFGESDVD
jgi:hypothetical protein